MADEPKRAFIITGDREWHDGAMISRRLGKRYPAGSIMIHGDAKGADRLAAVQANSLKLIAVGVPYISWLGRAGGPARNGYMLKMLLGLQEMGYEISVEAFHDDLNSSKGTIDMMKAAKKAGVKVKWNHH